MRTIGRQGGTIESQRTLAFCIYSCIYFIADLAGWRVNRLSALMCIVGVVVYFIALSARLARKLSICLDGYLLLFMFTAWNDNFYCMKNNSTR